VNEESKELRYEDLTRALIRPWESVGARDRDPETPTVTTPAALRYMMGRDGRESGA
jgi:hypothetical protein